MIDNIYDGNKFVKSNLDSLADAVGYKSMKKLADEAVKDDFEPLTSANFGGKVVKFGSYTFKDTTRELTWIPTYVSNATVDENNDGIPDLDENGNTKKVAILTLWLATVATANGTISNQEIARFTDGTYAVGTTKSKTYNGSTVYSDCYDSSYVRNYVLNGSTNYLTNWGSGTSNTPPAESTMTKFSSFVGDGELADYIVEPKYVSWQMNESAMKNDPAWKPAAGDKGTAANYPSGWTNDKIWLPSIYEMCSNSGGLWKTTVNERMVSTVFTSTRSGTPTYTHYSYQVNNLGECSAVNHEKQRGVRPALHLNLSMISECQHNLEKHPAVSYCDKDGHEDYWQCTECDAMFSDSEGKTEIKEPVAVGPAGHDYSDEWETNGSNHWHVCANGCGIKGSDGAHIWNDGKITTPASCKSEGVKTYTCTECNATKTESISIVDHSWGEWTTVTPATEEQEGVKERECSVCHKKETAPIPQLEHKHKFAEGWTSDENNHWHAATCGHTAETKDLAAHSWNDGDITTPASCTATGVKTFTCTVCGKTRTETIAKVSHDLESHEAQAATCNGKGWNAYDTCKNCDYTTYKEIPALGHDYQAVEGGVAPTCTEAGSGKVKCTRCGDEQVGASIPALGHLEATDEAKAPTCTETGLTAGAHCSRCDEVLTAQEEVPALGHDFGEWETTEEATFTEDGLQRRECSRCDEFEEEVIPALDVEDNEINLDLSANFEYGDEIAPVVSSNYGEIALVWYDTETGEELAEKPTTPGSYKLVARVEENLELGYEGAEKEVEFTIKKRAITVTINPASSKAGDELEELTATVTSGSIVNGDMPYTLSTDAVAGEMGEYEITGTCTNDYYEITFENAAYIVSKKEEDDEGNEIDMPVDIDVEFKVTQSSTGNDYLELAGMKRGYWAQLWYRNGDGTLGEEFTDKMNCILTLKIPDEIIEAIRGDEPIDRDKITEGLRVYYVDEDGDLKKVKPFTIAQKEDESWIIKFNYNSTFRAEVVFHALGIEEAGEPAAAAGIPWWVWLIVGLAGAALVGVVVVIIVLAKKKGGGGDGGVVAVAADNGEVIGRLDKQDEKIDRLIEITDGGFNDFADE